MPGAMTTSTGEGTSEAPTTGAGFFGVRLATLVTYLPRAAEPVAASVDPLASGVMLSIEVDEQSFPGVYDGGPWVEFADVPEVMYRAKRVGLANPDLPATAGVVTYTESSARVRDVGQVFSGRPDVALAASDATALALSVSDMQAFAEGDEFELYSYDADALVFARPSLMMDDGTQSPLPGDTTLGGWVVPWTPQTTRPGTPLIDPGAGDALWLTHLIRSPVIAEPTEEQLKDAWGHASVVSAIYAAELSLAPMVDGQTAAASGSFFQVNGMITTLDLPLSQYAAELAAEFAPTSALSCTATVFVEPGIDLPVYGMTPTLARVEVGSLELAVDPLCPPDACDPQLCPDGCETTLAVPGDRTVDVTYTNPYKLGTEMLSVYCSDVIGTVHPTAGTPESLFADVSAGRPLAAIAGKPATPTLGLVRNIRVNDALLPPTEVATGAGTTPTISFSSPSGFTPDSYVVQVRTLEDVVDEQANILSRRRLIASIVTTNTSVTLPAGILEAGSYYHVLVTAQSGQELDAGRPHSHTSGFTRAPSGMFTP